MADGGGATGAGLRLRSLRALGAAGVVVAVVGVVARILATDLAIHLLGSILVLAGALAFLAATIAGVVRRELRRQAALVTSTAERWLVEVLPPARVLNLLLDRVYGRSDANQAVVTSVLGGAGQRADCSDLTISERTDIRYRLIRMDEERYQLVMRAEYSFRAMVPVQEMAIFVTSDPMLRDSIVSASRLPFFELLYIREDDHRMPFAEAVDLVKESVRIGMVYETADGAVRQLDSLDPGDVLRDRKLSEWSRYLTLFRDDGDARALRPADYMDSLRIFQVRLEDMAGLPADQMRVRRLTVQSSSPQQFVDGFCYWQAPYPCFLETMHVDTESFTLDGERRLQFHVKPYIMGKTALAPGSWWAGDKEMVLPVNEWLTAGHGIALIWRMRDGEEQTAAEVGESDATGPPQSELRGLGSADRDDPRAPAAREPSGFGPPATGERDGDVRRPNGRRPLDPDGWPQPSGC